jgi:hypothetical protein
MMMTAAAARAKPSRVEALTSLGDKSPLAGVLVCDFRLQIARMDEQTKMLEIFCAPILVPSSVCRKACIQGRADSLASSHLFPCSRKQQ